MCNPRIIFNNFNNEDNNNNINNNNNLPRSLGGRGLRQNETTYKTTTIGQATYLERSA